MRNFELIFPHDFKSLEDFTALILMFVYLRKLKRIWTSNGSKHRAPMNKSAESGIQIKNLFFWKREMMICYSFNYHLRKIV